MPPSPAQSQIDSKIATLEAGRTPTWRSGFPFAVILAIACAGFLISQRPQPCDDAYITFRHVRNFVEHGRPAWNLHGTPVLGSTTPAFMFLLSIPAFLFGPMHLPWIALCVNAIFLGVIVVQVFLILRDFGCSVFPSLLGASLIGVNSVNVMIFAEGFENAMLTATILGALYAGHKKSCRTSVLLASFAPLIRPEGILVTGIVWTILLLRRRARWYHLALTLIAPILWLAFSIHYYGSPIPESLQAMRRFPEIYYPYESQPVDPFSRLPGIVGHLSYLWKDPAEPLIIHGMWKNDASDIVTITALFAPFRVAIVSIGAILAGWYAIRRRGPWLTYIAYSPLFLICFSLLRYTKPWYYPSFVTLSLTCVMGGLFAALQEVNAWMQSRNPATIIARIHVICILVSATVLLSAQRYGINHGEYDYVNKGPLFARHPFGKLWELWEDQRHYQYRQAAEFSNARAKPEATALITEVGVFGFYYHGEVLDTIGLCSPEALRFYPPPNDDIWRPDGQLYSKAETFAPTAMITELRPEYVVNSRTYLSHLFREGSPFLEDYVQLAELGKVWGEPLLIFGRRDIAADNGQ